jgi:putative ABC transport system permease protein
MKGAFLLGWRYLTHHRYKTAVLLASVTLMMFLPSATRTLVADSAASLTARADATPLLIGARGGDLELVLSALYFHGGNPPAITRAAYDAVRDSGLAQAIPLNTRFRARGAPIVGTNLDYFRFRGLRLADGRMMGLLGECVLGANVARTQGVSVGDSLVSSPETVFDLAGVYPLKMKITGVLAPSGSPDDDAVFVDFRTTWVIQGLGHGHQDLAGAEAAGSVLSRTEGTVTANAALVQYNEITPENVAECTLLRGRYQDAGIGERLLVPRMVLGELLETVFTVQNYVILGLVMLSLATVAVITLVFLLSPQLRQGEFYTLRRMGASRVFIATLVASEIGFVFLFAAALAFAMTWVAGHYANEWLLSFMTL